MHALRLAIYAALIASSYVAFAILIYQWAHSILKDE